MKAKVRTFQAAYRHLLRDCLNGAGEFALQRGYELGRQAMLDGLGVMDILSTQQTVLLELLADAETVNDCIQAEKSSQDLFTECLAPFELTHRGFLDVESLNKKLEAVNRELESFSYSVSHDLRAPLRAIDGYARMILRQQGDKFDENTKYQFDVIRNNVKTMGQLIDDLLALSRLGREALSLSRLNMEELTRNVWKELKAVNPDRPMDLKIDHVPPGMGDRMLMGQVLINILSNAIKFTRIREVPLIEVGGYVTETENVYYVRDNGIGFDMQYHDKLWLFLKLSG